jgi:hypothetical protein
MLAIRRIPLIFFDEHARRTGTNMGRESLRFGGFILLWLIVVLAISTPAFADKEIRKILGEVLLMTCLPG